MTTLTCWPTAFKLSDEGRSLLVEFEGGKSYTFTAEFLRVNSPSAEVQGHSPDQKTTVARKKNVAILRMEPVGNYAVRLVFDDGHDTGLFTWEYFYESGANQEKIWQDYLDALAAKNLTR